jgi:RNA polymerase sigma-70 factor (ECF subfamily)
MMQQKSPFHKELSEMEAEFREIQRAQDDARFFEPLYKRYHEPVFRFIYQRVSDKEDAFDITSQVFLKAITHLSKYQFRGVPFSSWLFRIAFSEINQAFRNDKFKHTVHVDAPAAKRLSNEMEDDLVSNYEKWIPALLNKLDEEDVSMIEMRFFEGRSFKEIGEILGITENNAKVRGHRALERLRTVYKKYAEKI